MGQKVWTVDEVISYDPPTYKIIGYDHLGPIGRMTSREHSCFKVREHKFTYSMLDKYGINKIFLTEELAEDYKEFGMREIKRGKSFYLF